MAIKKFYSNKAKAGWRWDEKQKKFWSWGFDIYLADGKRKRESGFGNKSLAENAVARIKLSEKERKYNLGTFSFPTVTEVCRKRIERIENEKEQVRANTVLNRWLGMLPPRMKLNELTSADIRLYIDARMSEIKAVSIDREITIIGATLHDAVNIFPELEKNWICPKIPRPKREKSRRERLISQSEVITLLTALLAPMADGESPNEYRKRKLVGQVFQMCLMTAARVGEIIGMRWEQVDFQQKTLQIVGTKGRFKTAKVVRYLEMTETIETILRERLSAGKEFVFSKNGKMVTHYHKIMKETAERVGLKYGAKVTGGFTTHDARHTAITRMIQSGVDLSTIGSISGHTDATLILHYSHATSESRKQAVKVLDDFVKFREEKMA